MKTALIFINLFISTLSTVYSEIYPRYNLAGYDSDRPKEIIIMSDEPITGNSWHIQNFVGTIVLSGTIGNSVTGTGKYTPKPYNYTIDFSALTEEGIYFVNIESASLFTIKITCRPYSSVTSDILRTIRVRRSGSADALDHALSHKGDTACIIYQRTGNDNTTWTANPQGRKADMFGGFYDAGDYIKFTLTNAYLTYFLLRSYETNPEYFNGVKLYSTTALNDLLDEAKWGLDFLMKTMPDQNTFIIQTGGYRDHQEWPLRLPENDQLDGHRECYSAMSKSHMGLTAAALALGAKVFEGADMSATATLYRNKAIEIYSAAKASNESIAWFEKESEIFYKDNADSDNMELAAIELHMLTNDMGYLNDAKSFSGIAGPAYWTSWANINMTAHSRLYPFYTTANNYLTNDLNYFKSTAEFKNNIWGLPHQSTWGSLYSQFGVANGALQYEEATDSETYINIAYDVLDYTFGKNPWGLSFIASQQIPKSIQTSYATIYKLQPGKFPYGEIAEGPAPADIHTDMSQYFSPAHNPDLWHAAFNTSDFIFFEQAGDFVCMETTIGGLADGIFLLSMANKYFCSEPMITNNITFPSKNKIEIYPNPASEILYLKAAFPDINYIITDLPGTEIKKGISTNGSIDIKELIEGNYLLEIYEGNTRKVIKFIKI